MPGMGQQAGSPQRAPLSPGTTAPARPGTPSMKTRHLHLSRTSSLAPAPGSARDQPGSALGAPEGAQLGGATSALRTPGTAPPHPPLLGSGQPGHFQHCPAVPAVHREPQTQPSSGRKAQGNPWPHLSPAGDAPLASPWLGRHQSPNPPGVQGGPGATAPAPLSPDSRCPGGFGVSVGSQRRAAPPWHSPALADVHGHQVTAPWACQCPPVLSGVPAGSPQPPGQSPPRAQSATYL